LTWAGTVLETSLHANPAIGGHSLTLANLATKMTQTFGHSIPLAQLAANPTLEGHLQVVKAARDGQVAAVQADLPAVLRADSRLDDDIRPINTEYRPLSDAETILLTGATGFLGGFLLKDLVESTTAKVVCLVRFNDPSENDFAAGMARIRKNLLDLGLWNDSISERLTVLPGNMSRKRLGLSMDQFNKLTSTIRFIIHAAATVNLVYPYALLRGANVDGTKEIIRLACLSGATLLYISTNGVLPQSQEGWTEDTRLLVEDVLAKIPDGYGQTKWAAEELVHEAGYRELPIRIMRAGTISGHSVTGSTNTYDLLTAIIVESLHLGFAPNVQGWRAEMTPVDSIAKSILHIANATNVPKSFKTFHLGEPDPVDTSILFDYLGELSFPTKRLAWDEWVNLWYEKRGNSSSGGAFTADILRGGMPTIDFLRDITVLKDTKTKTVLADLPRPRLDRKLLEVYARHWYSRGWLPHRPVRISPLVPTLLNGTAPITGPLSGRVAVVTGASSGIGAAIAIALATQGASVSLAARRIDALKNIQDRIEAAGGKAIAIETDVTSHAQVFNLMQETKEAFSTVDILVVCAGVMYFTMMANAHIDQWNQTVDVNCKGLLNCLATAVPSMLKNGKGHIVAISSDAGRKVFPGLGVYSASKFFVEATLQSLRLETAGKGLRITSVQPGNVTTGLVNLSIDQEAVKKYGEPSGAKVLDPKDVADAVIYAVKQPEHVAVNEILIEPRDEPI
jgi:thioester reductase-like protein